jgi:hypothetical protein
MWTLYPRDGCAHSELTRSSLRATFSRCASRSSMARCSPVLRKNTPPLDTSPRSSSGLIVHGAWHVCQSAAFVARGLPPPRKVVAAKPACASVVAECTLLRTLHVRSSEKASWPNFVELRLGEVPRIPLPRTPVNKGTKKGRSPIRLAPSSTLVPFRRKRVSSYPF